MLVVFSGDAKSSQRPCSGSPYRRPRVGSVRHASEQEDIEDRSAGRLRLRKQKCRPGSSSDGNNDAAELFEFRLGSSFTRLFLVPPTTIRKRSLYARPPLNRFEWPRP